MKPYFGNSKAFFNHPDHQANEATPEFRTIYQYNSALQPKLLQPDFPKNEDFPLKVAPPLNFQYSKKSFHSQR